MQTTRATKVEIINPGAFNMLRSMELMGLIRIETGVGDQGNTAKRTFTLNDFAPANIDTTGWKFDREEANER
ncbi:MAG: hypothetical protein LBR23_04325 [Spirochaetaceae bacterium]|jgi:hypothetical protein|nr:hypothetical protein [Spirochaetaceae bacterium]